MAKGGRKQKKGISEMVLMAQPAALAGTSGPTTKQIPLLCSVCPDTPRFSDVSHLLTHIASKGHLHHETQTKLKAHQDSGSSEALRQYEEWYRDNAIESLLVERMKAKQVKESARNKRARPSSSAPRAKSQKNVSRTSRNNTIIKTEHAEFTSDLAVFPGYFASDNEIEMADGITITADTMTLKGQVWPGMGKMDLANEEMRRTRNQRKPKSAVERMRRTSEGIEPTQVVMTSQFDVERIKWVYDEESPVSDQEDPSPARKVTRPRRKKAEPLAEISANVPRGNNGRVSRSTTSAGKAPKTGFHLEQNLNTDRAASFGSSRPVHDVFRDTNYRPEGVFENGTFAGKSERKRRFDTRDKIHILNPFSHANMVSPTPPSRDLSSRMLVGKDATRTEFHDQPCSENGNHLSWGSFTQQEESYSLTDAPMYQYGNRVPFAATAHCASFGHDHFRLPSNTYPFVTQNDYAHAVNDDTLGNLGQNLFMDISGTSSNPLFSQEHFFLNSYNHQETQNHVTESIKAEPPVSGTTESTHLRVMWPAQGPESDLALHDDLESDELGF